MKAWRCRFALPLAALCAIGSTALAAAPELERIAADRAIAQARYVERERHCLAQFAVTACLDAARQERRATLNRLKRSEIEVEEAERRAAAATRQSAVDARMVEQRRRNASGPAAAPKARVDRDAASQPGEPAAASRLLPRPPASRLPDAERRAVEQRKVMKFEARQRSAQARREAVERRNALRAAQGKNAPPLPVPSPASVPRR